MRNPKPAMNLTRVTHSLLKHKITMPNQFVFSVIIATLSLPALSFAPAPANTVLSTPYSADSLGTEIDPHAYIRVGYPGPWNDYSNTLVVPGIACGGGPSSPCELYLSMEVNGGNTNDPDLFVVVVYKNNVEIDAHGFNPYFDSNATETYIGDDGDRFHLAIYSYIVTSTGGSGGTSHPSITALLEL